MAFETRLALSVCPHLQSDEQRLMASSSWLVRLLAFGLLLRRVVVDRPSQTVCIEQRTAWFFQRRRVIPFAHIAAITYGYEDINPFTRFSVTHDAVDRFVVGLRIYGNEEVKLFSFVGDGVFTNDGPLPDWWYWEDYLADFAGTQERESQLFVQLLSKLIGVTIVPSSLTRDG